MAISSPKGNFVRIAFLIAVGWMGRNGNFPISLRCCYTHLIGFLTSLGIVELPNDVLALDNIFSLLGGERCTLRPRNNALGQ